MGTFIKAGRVIVMLNGRYAGKKAVVVKPYDDGSRTRPYGHCLVEGVLKPFQKVTRKMSKKKVNKRLRVKPFVKYVNFYHMMPTRYQAPSDLDTKALVSDAQMGTPDGRSEACHQEVVRRKVQESTS